ncbi:MAG TPA: hypothetical protein PK629_11905 [Oscillospiraceae bacterium]|nr:hypothetical protein [Oscillospiraceae bacterium]HPF55128.1 hypothetical protein [Clostridiales bacterium]HPK34554.1 hypothetical protein [Oscillospiraceae bacterium]HPR74782.1 hypothetical protein [Oscillospiraceae bacterium]
MTQQLKKYVTVQTVIAFFVNGILNGIIAYFLNKDKSLELITMPENFVNLVIDIGITAIIFAWLIAWSVNANLKKANYYGVIEPKTKLQSWMGRMFKKPARYGWLLCIGMIPLLYGLTCLGIWIFGVTRFTLWGYVWYKTGYTAVMGASFSLIFMFSGFLMPKPQAEPKDS